MVLLRATGLCEPQGPLLWIMYGWMDGLDECRNAVRMRARACVCPTNNNTYRWLFRGHLKLQIPCPVLLTAGKQQQAGQWSHGVEEEGGGERGRREGEERSEELNFTSANGEFGKGLARLWLSAVKCLPASSTNLGIAIR